MIKTTLPIHPCGQRSLRLALILVTFIIYGFTISASSQSLPAGGAMDDSTYWHVYQLAYELPAAYTFNDTTAPPTQGHGGCLQVTAAQRANMLFWQEVTLQSGRVYQVDGAIKVGPATNFWCEVYLSTIAPVAGQDYAPNGNADVIRGFSTWVGCGPGVDGTFRNDACTGERLFLAPGTIGQDTTLYFALKTGSSAQPFADTLRVSIDDLQIQMLQDSLLVSTADGFIDPIHQTVRRVSPNITIEQFRSGLRAAPTATIDIVGLQTGESVPGQDTMLMADTLAVKVTGLNGTALYPISLRSVSDFNHIIRYTFGNVDHHHLKISVPHNVRVAQLVSAITVAPRAALHILLPDSTEADPLALVQPSMQVQVAAENGNLRRYQVMPLPKPVHKRILTDYQDTLRAFRNVNLTFQGTSEVTITAREQPLPGCMVNLVGNDHWLYFPNIRPAEFYASYLPQIMIGGEAAVPHENMRLVQYLQGTLLISQPATYQPLEIFTGEALSGSGLQLGLYNYYRAAELGDWHHAIRSFRLKKGYMATFAQEENGTGYSRIYVADQEDIVIDSLPQGLYDEVSFIRIIPWRWATKKGWTSGRDLAEALQCSWHYDWNNEAVSDFNVEYIPMRHNRYWNSFENINNKQHSTHALGFNEPERSDQANMTVDEAIALWPELLKSGLRLGSPAPSDGGLSWLYEFIDRCDVLNYRVDFVAMHWYRGGQSALQYYNTLKEVHERTGRPIWITEWNNGANWTCCKPTYEEQAETIGRFLHMLDTTSFVERYSLYEWVEDTRHMFYKAPVILTPAGEVYHDNLAPMAYNPNMAYVQAYVIQPDVPEEYIGEGIGFDYGRALAVDVDQDGDLDIAYSGVDPIGGGILLNDGTGTFLQADTLQGLYIPSLDAGDIDGDGDLDLILAGWDRDHSWASYARVLYNNLGAFTPTTPPVYNAPAAGMGDYDNNGYMDYFMVGNGNHNPFYFQYADGFADSVDRLDNGHNIQDPFVAAVDIDRDQDIDFCMQAWDYNTNRRYTQFWYNQGHGVFTEQTIPFKQKHWGSTQYADIDADGDLDMLLYGDGDTDSDDGSHTVFRLYVQQDSGLVAGATFQPYRQNTSGPGSRFVDWDNDGDYDLILSGWQAELAREVVHIYLNDGLGNFTLSAESNTIPGVDRGTLEPGDFDGDGKIDLLINGYSGTFFARNVAFLYRNSTAQANTAPLPPADLTASVTGDSVAFSWLPGNDAETSVAALTYNLYVKDAAGRYLLFPNANITNGLRMTVGMGNAYNNLGWHLQSLAPGTYTCGVQTIDAGYAGSAFTAPVSFTVAAVANAARIAGETLTHGAAEMKPYVWPNPARTQLKVQAGSTPVSKVAIYTLSGSLVHLQNLQEADNTIAVSQLPAGLYFVQMYDQSGITTDRIVITGY